MRNNQKTVIINLLNLLQFFVLLRSNSLNRSTSRPTF